MYIGRFVILGRTAAGNWYLGYRVSSRSFPNRLIKQQGDRAVVLPTADAPPSDNPYISYNCMRRHEQVVVVANGSHVDPTIDKVKIGYPLRDAMALSLLAMDYEHDSYNTPRISAGLDLAAGVGYLGIVADDQVSVRRLDVAPGEAMLIATYEHTVPTAITLAGDSAKALCDALFECEYDKPVATMVALPDGDAIQVASRSARD